MKYYIMEDEEKDRYLINIDMVRFAGTTDPRDGKYGIILLMNDQPCTIGGFLSPESVREARDKLIEAVLKLEGNELV